MNKVTEYAYAKINLSLDVLRKREDGYHDLRMVMQQIDLKDVITVKNSDEVKIECNNPKVPTDTSNLVCKAYRILADKFNIKKGVNINIEKNIPIAAGLAGGSSDAAATLKGLNKLWNLNLTDKELMELAVNIGADVPYCILGGTALAEGIGEELTTLKSFEDKLVLIAKPDIDVSTAYVYTNLKLDKLNQHPNTENIINNIESDDIISLSNNMINVLETVTINKYKIIEDLKTKMLKYGALGSLMSGSGPTVFGLFDDMNKMENCYNELRKDIKEVYITKTI